MQLLDSTLGEMLEKWAYKTPGKDFMIYPDRNLRFTYSEFNNRVDALAKGLLFIGIKQEIKLVSGLKMYPIG